MLYTQHYIRDDKINCVRENSSRENKGNLKVELQKLELGMGGKLRYSKDPFSTFSISFKKT